MDFLIWVWVIIMCSSAVIEFFSMQMVAVWFTFSSLVAIILSLCGVLWWVQVLVFCIVALVLLLALRRFSLKFLLKNTDQKTNIDSVVGTTHKLLESIEPEKAGSIKINGVIWTAVCEDENKTLKENEFVKIVKVSGNKLIVKSAKNEK